MCKELCSVYHSDTHISLHILPWLLQTGDPSSKPLKLKHFFFTAWPDHGVPQHPYSMVKFIQHIRKVFPDSTAPLVVHCRCVVWGCVGENEMALCALVCMYLCLCKCMCVVFLLVGCCSFIVLVWAELAHSLLLMQ